MNEERTSRFLTDVDMDRLFRIVMSWLPVRLGESYVGWCWHWWDAVASSGENIVLRCAHPDGRTANLLFPIGQERKPLRVTDAKVASGPDVQRFSKRVEQCLAEVARVAGCTIDDVRRVL